MCSHSKFDLSTRLLSYDTVIYRIPRYIEFYSATEFYCIIATVYGQSSYILPVGAKRDRLEGFSNLLLKSVRQNTIFLPYLSVRTSIDLVLS